MGEHVTLHDETKGRLRVAQLLAVRWEILCVLNAAGYVGVTETMLLSTISDMWPGITGRFLRDQLAYLELIRREHGDSLVVVERHEVEDWHAQLSAYGTDVVTYIVPCLPGIRRPLKQWGDAET